MTTVFPVIWVTGNAGELVLEEVSAALVENQRCGFATTIDPKSEEDVFHLRIDADVGAQDPSIALGEGLGNFDAHYDFRYIWAPEDGSTIQEFLQLFDQFTARLNEGPTLVSTRGSSPRTTFLKAVKEGLAPDGGLYIAEELPCITLSQLAYFCKAESFSYIEGAQMILELILDTSISPLALHSMLLQAYRKDRWSDLENICPLRPLYERYQRAGPKLMRHVSVLELYHGPTAAFKDFALQLFPYFFQLSIAKSSTVQKLNRGGEEPKSGYEAFHAQQNEAKKRQTANRYLILAATSGDTGVSAISGFQNIRSPDIKVAVLYPLHGVSPVQRLQMLNMDNGKQVRVYGVKSDFDFCQSMVKEIFNSMEIKNTLASLGPHRTFLSSANSINYGRLIPQVVYYFWLYRQLVRGNIASKRISSSTSLRSGPDSSGSSYTAYEVGSLSPYDFQFGMVIDVVVPCGNFGNILAAFMAKIMGLPIRRLIVASNSNDVLCEFINTGKYTISKRSLVPTASPSIDILVSSNIERFLYLLTSGDVGIVSSMMHQLSVHKSFTLPDYLTEIMQRTFWAGTCSEERCGKVIFDVFESSRGMRVLDTHTAVAIEVAEQYRKAMVEKEEKEYFEEHDARSDRHRSSKYAKGLPDSVLEVPLVVAGTAHWSKFPVAVDKALRGQSLAGNSRDAATTPTPKPDREAGAEASSPKSFNLSMSRSATQRPVNSRDGEQANPTPPLQDFRVGMDTIFATNQFDELSNMISTTNLRYKEIATLAQHQGFTVSHPHPVLKQLVSTLHRPSGTELSLLGGHTPPPSTPNATKEEMVSLASPKMSIRELEEDKEAVISAVIDFCRIR